MTGRGDYILADQETGTESRRRLLPERLRCAEITSCPQGCSRKPVAPIGLSVDIERRDKSAGPLGHSQESLVGYLVNILAIIIPINDLALNRLPLSPLETRTSSPVDLPIRWRWSSGGSGIATLLLTAAGRHDAAATYNKQGYRQDAR